MSKFPYNPKMVMFVTIFDSEKGYKRKPFFKPAFRIYS